MITTKHTCGGVKFGRKTVGCPRCDELLAGAAPIEQAFRASAKHRANMDALELVALRKHDCKAAGCGAVCTDFDY